LKKRLQIGLLLSPAMTYTGNLQVVVEPLDKRGEDENWRPWHTNEELVAGVRVRAARGVRTPRGSKKARAAVMHVIDTEEVLVVSK